MKTSINEYEFAELVIVEQEHYLSTSRSMKKILEKK